MPNSLRLHSPFQPSLFLLASLCLLSLTVSAPAQTRPQKKLIEYGWDVPTPDFIQKNIIQMTQRPFDGLIFRLRQGDHAFDTRPWQPAGLQPDLDALASIQWGKFTDNFVLLFAANKQNMDWFDDAQWAVITANLKLFARAVKAGRCVGVCFDPEPYGPDPWVFKDRFGDKPARQVFDQARRRGRQFITVLQSEQPSLKILSFFQLALFGSAMDEPDPERRTQNILNRSYGLWYPFYLGMLEGAAPGVTFIDGNESSYYYDRSESYYRAYHLMRQRALTLIPAELRGKYNAQSQAGTALYVDQVYGLRSNVKTLGHFLAPAEQARFFEHNAYYALDTCDEYVWCYGEKMDWWGSRQGRDASGASDIPPGLEQALVSARRKIEQGKPLGFDIREMIDAAQKKKAGKK